MLDTDISFFCVCQLLGLQEHKFRQNKDHISLKVSQGVSPEIHVANSLVIANVRCS